MASVVKKVTYVKSDVGKNNNKVWIGTLFDDNRFVAQYGRIGKTLKPDEHKFSSAYEAEKFFNKKCREKEGDKKGYRKLDVVDDGTQIVTTKIDIKDVIKQQIKDYSDPVLAELFDLFHSKNIHNIVSSTKDIAYNNTTGLFSTKCGIVTYDYLNKATDLLGKMIKFVEVKDFNNKQYINFLQDYLMLIPQEVGRRLSSDLYPDVTALTKQYDIIKSLEASLDSISKGNVPVREVVDEPVDNVFNIRIEICKDSKEFDRITDNFVATMQKSYACSHLRPKRAFFIDIVNASERFNKAKDAIGNIHELYHGSRVSNCLSILSKGLIIPRSSDPHVCGRSFGDGVYFAPRSSKAANYSWGYWDSKSKDNNCFMFLSQVACGKVYTPKSSYEQLPKKGYDSTWAKADVSGVINDEVIVYDLKQCNLTHLIELSPDGK